MRNKVFVMLAFLFSVRLSLGMVAPRFWEEQSAADNLPHSLEEVLAATPIEDPLLVEIRRLRNGEGEPGVEPSERALFLAEQAVSGASFHTASQAFGQAVDLADKEQAEQLLDWALEDRTVRLHLAPLAERLLALTDGSHKVVRFLSLLARETEDAARGDAFQRLALERIIALARSDAELVEALLPVVLREERWIVSEQAARTIAPLITPADPRWPSIRDFAVDYIRRCRHYHPAVEILSYHGEEGIMEALQMLLEEPVYGRAGSGPGMLVTSAIWRIESQRNPDHLLLHINARPDESNYLAFDIGWMMHRAHLLGVEKERIRAEVLQYCEGYRNQDGIDWRFEPGRWRFQRPRIVEMGKKLGIISSEDRATMPVAAPPVGSPVNYIE